MAASTSFNAAAKNSVSSGLRVPVGSARRVRRSMPDQDRSSNSKNELVHRQAASALESFCFVAKI